MINFFTKRLLPHLVAFYVIYIIIFSIESKNFFEYVHFMIKHGFMELMNPITLSLIPLLISVIGDYIFKFTLSKRFLALLVYGFLLPLLSALFLIY